MLIDKGGQGGYSGGGYGGGQGSFGQPAFGVPQGCAGYHAAYVNRMLTSLRYV